MSRVFFAYLTLAALLLPLKLQAHDNSNPLWPDAALVADAVVAGVEIPQMTARQVSISEDRTLRYQVKIDYDSTLYTVEVYQVHPYDEEPFASLVVSMKNDTISVAYHDTEVDGLVDWHETLDGVNFSSVSGNRGLQTEFMSVITVLKELFCAKKIE